MNLPITHPIIQSLIKVGDGINDTEKAIVHLKNYLSLKGCDSPLSAPERDLIRHLEVLETIIYSARAQLCSCEHTTDRIDYTP